MSLAGFSAASARSAAWFTSRSASAATCASSASVASPPPSSCRSRMPIGSRAASASRSAGRLVQPLVVGQRVRIRPDDLCVNERRAAPLARMGDGLLEHPPAGQEVGPVHRQDQQAGERRHDLREIAARRLDFPRHRDGVAVVLDEIDNRQPLAAGRIQRFPELALGRRAFARRDVDDLVRVMASLAIRDVGDALVESPGLGAADSLQALRAGRAALRHDVQTLVSPVRRHLAASRRRVVAGPHGLEQHLVRRDAQRQAECPIAVIGKEPVVGRTQHRSRSHEDRLMAGAADLEEDPALVLELDLLVVQFAGQHHPAPCAEQRVARRRSPVRLAVARRSIHAPTRQ